MLCDEVLQWYRGWLRFASTSHPGMPRPQSLWPTRCQCWRLGIMPLAASTHFLCCFRIRQSCWTPHASEVVIKPPELVPTISAVLRRLCTLPLTGSTATVHKFMQRVQCGAIPRSVAQVKGQPCPNASQLTLPRCHRAW